MESIFQAISDAGATAPHMYGGFQSLNVEVDGAAKQLYIVTNDGFSGGSTLGVPHNTRGYLAESADGGPESFFRPNLLGGSVEYDVDLSQMECGCIAAFYTVSMPAKDWNGNYVAGKDGHYYCDANKVDGTFCPEFDIMEANKFAYQTTPHSCDSPNEHGYYSNCNKPGACW